MSTKQQFIQLLTIHGSPVIFHREEGGTDCPCLTPEGFRDPAWHVANPNAPVCNADGKIPVITQISLKGFVQPAQSTRATRLSSEDLQQLFGTIRVDDHIGILPCEWNGQVLNFDDWSQNGEDWIECNNVRYLIVNVNILPDPSDGNPNHHVEAGLRVIRHG